MTIPPCISILILCVHTQRKFVCNNKPSKDKLHEQFRVRLDANPSLDLDEVVAEDQAFDYVRIGPAFTESTRDDPMLPQFSNDDDG